MIGQTIFNRVGWPRFLEKLGISDYANTGVWIGDAPNWPDNSFFSFNPSTGDKITEVRVADRRYYDAAVRAAEYAQIKWRKVPSPVRFQLVKEMCKEIASHKTELALLAALEMGKPVAEGEGEIQEILDLLEKCGGLARDLGERILPSERAGYELQLRWRPVGVVGLITPSNFPYAIWGWDMIPALICGNTIVWRPSPDTPLCSIAIHRLCAKALGTTKVMDQYKDSAGTWRNIINLVVEDRSEIAKRITCDPRIPLVSFTGSCSVGCNVLQQVTRRGGRCLLELGGNNAMIVMPSADVDEVAEAVFFGTLALAGQRCTTLRRLIVHEDIAPSVISKVVALFRRVRIGDPLDSRNHMGPLISGERVEKFLGLLKVAEAQGAYAILRGSKMPGPGNFVRPAIFGAHKHLSYLAEEPPGPMLSVIAVKSLDEAVRVNNNVPQGLSCSIFTREISEWYEFMEGADCGMITLNGAPAGAEIGGLFGGTKETDLGTGTRKSGGHSFYNYLEPVTVTVKHSKAPPRYAQGLKISLDE